jgi:hypothetical protein
VPQPAVLQLFSARHNGTKLVETNETQTGPSMRYFMAILLGASLCVAAVTVEAEPPAKKVEPQPIAQVLGKPISLADLHIVESDKTDLRDFRAIAGEILAPLRAKYIKEHKLEATEAEMTEFEEFLAAIETKTPSKKKEPLKPQKPEHEIARFFIEQWKFHKALHDKYGGRVIFQQAGLEPLDAYVKWLADEEKAGNFQVFDPKWKDAFAEYYYKPKYHRFLDGETKDPFKAPFWRTPNDAKKKAELPQ